MRLIKILGAIIVVLIIIVLIGKNKGWFGGNSGIPVFTDTVQKRNIVETVTASGKIYPVKEVKISAEISGEIVDLNVQEGDKVKEGELLMRINPDIYQSQVAQAQAAVDNAKANLATAKARVLQTKMALDNQKLSFNRSKQLHDQKVISDQDFETAQLTYNNAQADYDVAQETETGAEYSIKSAEATLDQMKESLDKTSIFAPTSGTVFQLSKKKGEKVLGTIQMTGDDLMHIADLNNMEVQVDVSENDVIRINVGDTADVEVDAYLNRKFKGVVTQIANSAGTGTDALSQATQQATNFKVKVYLLPSSYEDLKSKDSTRNKYPFYPGMSATAEIKTKTKNNVLSIPIQAVTTQEDTTHREAGKQVHEIVFTDAGGKAKPITVETGIQDADYIEITKGLDDGQTIISGPYNTITNILKEGDKIKITQKENAKTKK